ncbi:ABC transporter substrate-binding protein [Arsenicicoccus dermatophilus]|uniref:ABC transporter substrate-binding protein n=1 Tax=Arsenicicoccus dermatophilus TaxID=1076331 RepID=UPI001F4CA5DA|nr:ABC transporter substrate-binding protein [Arsenicicoccus dermatophilus]MCH8613088.1 ABC transporter substrate-binding protein [Arsenicicoccus dermatophilus]
MTTFPRRGFLGLTTAVTAAVALAGCAGTGSSSAGSAGGTTTIDFWSNHPGKSKDTEKKLIEQFEKANPGIKVKLTDAGKSYEEVAQKFNAALAGGNLPDAVVVSDVTWFTFALSKQLAPIDDLVKEAGLTTTDYVESLYTDYTLMGKHYALPYSRSTPLFYYNKDLWAKAGLPDRGPKTWDEFAAWAAKLQPVIGSDKVAIDLADGSNYLDWYFQSMAWGYGGGYSKEWTPTFTDPGTIKAGEYLKMLFAKKYARASADPATSFASGMSAALVESTGSLKGITKDAKFTLGTAFLPAPDGIKACPTGGAGIGIPAGISAERKKAAAKFVEFMTNAQSTVTFTQATGYMPVRTSAMDVPEEKAYLQGNPNAKTAVEQLPHTRSQDNARVGVPGGGKRIGTALDQIAQGGDVKSIFEGLQKETQSVIDAQVKSKL